MTSMQTILGRNVSFDNVKKNTIKNFKDVFDAEIEQPIALAS